MLNGRVFIPNVFEGEGYMNTLTYLASTKFSGVELLVS